MSIIQGVPDSCIAAGVIGTAGALAAAAYHQSSNTSSGKEIPNCCVAGGLLLGGSAAALAAHHGTLKDGLPPLHCMAGGVAGLALAAYGASQHSNPSKIPNQCIVSGVVGAGLLILGTKLAQSA